MASAGGGATAAALTSRLGQITLSGMAITLESALTVLATELFNEEVAR